MGFLIPAVRGAVELKRARRIRSSRSPLKRFRTVAVNDSTAPEAARSTSSFRCRRRIDALPDDPDELADVLAQMAGPGDATFFMNSFRAASAERDQIGVRFRQNNYAAATTCRPLADRRDAPEHELGGQVNTNFGGDRFNARQPQQLVEQPSQERQLTLTVRGPIKAGKTSFNLNVSGNNNYNSNPIIAIDEFGNPLNVAAQSTTDQKGFQAGLEHSLNANHSVLFNFQSTQNDRLNNPGGFTLPERENDE